MTKFYATTDADGADISKDAHIAAFDTEAEAVEYLRSAFAEFVRDAAAGGEPVEFKAEPGRFGDCWFKVHQEPRDDDQLAEWCAPFTPAEIIIQNPGQHPGGRAWWYTPTHDVLVATFEPAQPK